MTLYSEDVTDNSVAAGNVQGPKADISPTSPSAVRIDVLDGGVIRRLLIHMSKSMVRRSNTNTGNSKLMYPLRLHVTALGSTRT